MYIIFDTNDNNFVYSFSTINELYAFNNYSHHKRYCMHFLFLFFSNMHTNFVSCCCWSTTQIILRYY
eukprot:UN02886